MEELKQGDEELSYSKISQSFTDFFPLGPFYQDRSFVHQQDMEWIISLLPDKVVALKLLFSTRVHGYDKEVWREKCIG